MVLLRAILRPRRDEAARTCTGGDPRDEVPFASITAAGAALAEKVAAESTEFPAQQ
ncbi:hypothetical protein GCM10027289_21240 [Tsukamurella serpentis]